MAHAIHTTCSIASSSSSTSHHSTIANEVSPSSSPETHSTKSLLPNSSSTPTNLTYSQNKKPEPKPKSKTKKKTGKPLHILKSLPRKLLEPLKSIFSHPPPSTSPKSQAKPRAKATTDPKTAEEQQEGNKSESGAVIRTYPSTKVRCMRLSDRDSEGRETVRRGTMRWSGAWEGEEWGKGRAGFLMGLEGKGGRGSESK
ncbi:unnamed protein product [Periconia digitata]|uniref:Uncharacterized protein n=1 Tax=Periconia digitata TaxID=1303443 RepID=A0A9W4UQ86_9PLEO|nr:unnamed protein product [Periconia digitata]